MYYLKKDSVDVISHDPLVVKNVEELSPFYHLIIDYTQLRFLNTNDLRFYIAQTMRENNRNKHFFINKTAILSPITLIEV